MTTPGDDPVWTLACGGPAPEVPDPSIVDVSFPSAAESAHGVLSGTVLLRAGREPVAGVVSPLAEAFLASGGRVRTLPVAQDSVGAAVRLPSGGETELPAHVSLLSCDQDAPLPPGRYDLHVRVVVALDGGGSRQFFSSPRPLDLR